MNVTKRSQKKQKNKIKNTCILRIFIAYIDELLTNYGLNNAKNVVIGGCSAGGLATYLHTDYIRSVL